MITPDSTLRREIEEQRPPFPAGLLSRAEKDRLIERGLIGLYRWYLARSQAQRDWNPDRAFDWRALRHDHSPELLRIAEGFFAIEHYIPDYISQTVAQVAAKGVDGVNIDFEGLSRTCPNMQSARTMMTDLANQLRTALPAGSYLSVDTYASSAADPIGFFDVGGLNAYVDAFFVMAYDLEYSNYSRPPTSCTTFCQTPSARRTMSAPPSSDSPDSAALSSGTGAIETPS